MGIRTHYDALEVSRTAPTDVIVAAYRSLSKRYHPDRNIGDAGAAARMAELNAAYAVLMDEGKRREHDRWIAQQERARNAAPPTPAPGPLAGPAAKEVRRELVWWIAGGVAVAAVMVMALTIRVQPPIAMPVPETPVRAVPAPMVPLNATPLQPLTVPPGRPAAYMDAASAADEGGRSRITLDNSAATSAVEVQLVPLQPNGARRRVFLPAGGFFIMERVRGGRYRLAFYDLGDKTRSTSAPFQLGGGGKPGDLTFRLSQQ